MKRVIVIVLLSFVVPVLAQSSNYESHAANLGAVKIHYLKAGTGKKALVLIHGFGDTSHMWVPLFDEFGKDYTIIAPDMRGLGESSRPAGGYDKKTIAADIHELMKSLGVEKINLVGHDIGLMVAYAYAAQFPQETDRLVLMDAFLPGIGDWKNVWLMRDLWHFHFHGEVPLALVKGRERTYFEHFWNDFAADPKRSVSEADRRVYAKAYAQPNGMRAGFEYFKNFERDAKDFAELGATPLSMPVLVLGGEKSGGEFLVAQAKLVASNVQGKIISGSGHWLMDEAPQATIPALTTFLNAQP